MADIEYSIALDTTAINREIGKLVDKIETEFEQIKPKIDVDGSIALREIKKVGNEYDKLTRGASLSTNELKKALAQMTLAGQQGTKEFAQMKTQLEKSVAESKQLAKAMQAVENSIEEATKDAAKLDNELEDAGNNGGKKFGSGLSDGLKVGIAGAGIAIAAGLTSAISDAVGEFNKLDVATRSMSTLGAEAEALAPKLKEVSIEMSQRLPFAASQLQNSFTNAIASGVRGGEKELSKFVETAAKLAVGGGTDIDSATAGLAATLNAFGKSAEDAEKFADTFFNTVNFGVVSVDELNQYLSQVTPTAAAAGLSFENVGAGIALLTQKGVPAAQATTKLNALLIELQKPGSALKKIFQEGGLSIDDLKKTLETEGLPAALNKVEGAFKKAGKTATEAFSSSEAGSAFNVLQGKAGEFQETLDNVAGTAGSAGNAFDEMAGSMDNQMTLLKNQLNAALLPAIASIMPEVTKMVGGLSKELIPVMKDLITDLMPGLTTIIKLLIPIFIQGAKLAADLAESYGQLAKDANWLGQQINALFKSLGINIDVGKIFGFVMDGIRKTIVAMLNPIGAIRIAIESLLRTFGLLGDEAPKAGKKVKEGTDELTGAGKAGEQAAAQLKKFQEVQAQITASAKDKGKLKEISAGIVELGKAGSLSADQVTKLNEEIAELLKPAGGDPGKQLTYLESLKSAYDKLFATFSTNQALGKLTVDQQGQNILQLAELKGKIDEYETSVKESNKEVERAARSLAASKIPITDVTVSLAKMALEYAKIERLDKKIIPKYDVKELIKVVSYEEQLNELYAIRAEELKEVNNQLNEMLGTNGAEAVLTFAEAFGEGMQSIANDGIVTFKDLQKAGLMAIAETAKAQLDYYLPQILTTSISWLGPIAGPIAAFGLIGLAKGLLNAAVNKWGAEEGVVGIDGNYNKPKGATDTIPLWVAPGETIFSQKDTMKNLALFKHIKQYGTADGFLMTTSVAEDGSLVSELRETREVFRRELRQARKIDMYDRTQIRITDERTYTKKDWGGR